MQRPPRRLPSLLARRVSRRALLASLPAGSVAAALVSASCGGGRVTETAGAMATATPEAAPAEVLKMSVLTQDLLPGTNRFVFVLQNGDGALVDNVITSLKVRRGDRALETLSPTIRSLPRTDARGRAGGKFVYFVAEPEFDAHGDWTADVTAAAKDSQRSARYHFTVLERSRTPALGQKAVLSKNDTLDTETDASRLCSRTPPCPLHTTSVQAANAAGRPVVLQFSSPAHEATGVSASVLELLLGLQPAYGDRFDFVHVEVWKDHANHVFSPAVLEWGLMTEPWTFVIDPTGDVAGRFESVFDVEEMTAVLDWQTRYLKPSGR